MYEYKYFFEQPPLQLGIVEFNQWVTSKVNELGKQNWFCFPPSPADPKGKTQQIIIYAVREVLPAPPQQVTTPNPPDEMGGFAGPGFGPSDIMPT